MESGISSTQQLDKKPQNDVIFRSTLVDKQIPLDNVSAPSKGAPPSWNRQNDLKILYPHSGDGQYYAPPPYPQPGSGHYYVSPLYLQPGGRQYYSQPQPALTVIHEQITHSMSAASRVDALTANDRISQGYFSWLNVFSSCCGSSKHQSP